MSCQGCPQYCIGPLRITSGHTRSDIWAENQILSTPPQCKLAEKDFGLVDVGLNDVFVHGGVVAGFSWVGAT